MLIIFSFIFAQELQVDGDLTVTQSINASSFVGDGSALTNLPSIGGMKPDRIYSHKQYDESNYSFTVPENKFWEVVFSLSSDGYSKITVNSNEHI